MSLLKLWDYFHGQRAELSRGQLQKMCRREFLSYTRMREWLDIHRQLKQLVESSGFKLNKRHDDYGAIHRSLLTGLLSNVAKRVDQNAYQGMGGAKSYLWPGSHVFEERPDWVIAAEIIETKRRYLRTVARINSRWIEPRAGHLVERSYKNPRWSRRRGTVIANEKVSLYKLPVCSKRGQKYCKIDPEVSRELFIRGALIQREINAPSDFISSNFELIERLAIDAAKTRVSGLLVSDASQYSFYDQRLPRDVCDVATLRRWLRRAKPEEVDRLYMATANLVDIDATRSSDESFPNEMKVGESSLPIDYRFEPGEEDDGVSVTVPIEALSQIEAHQLQWGVPGLLHEKIVALIRSLPKSVRTNLIPAPDVATEAAKMIEFGQGPFLPTIARVLSTIAAEPIDPSAFRTESLPQHLNVSIRVVGGSGELLAKGRDLQELRQKLGVTATQAVDRVISDAQWEKDGIVAWDFGDLPESIELMRSGCCILAFPTLVDKGDSVSMRLLGNEIVSQLATRRAIRRLILFRYEGKLREQVDWLPRLNDLALYATTLPNRLVAEALDRPCFPICTGGNVTPQALEKERPHTSTQGDSRST